MKTSEDITAQQLAKNKAAAAEILTRLSQSLCSSQVDRTSIITRTEKL